MRRAILACIHTPKSKLVLGYVRIWPKMGLEFVILSIGSASGCQRYERNFNVILAAPRLRRI